MAKQSIFIKCNLILDKERDVQAMTNRIRNELNEEVSKRQLLLNEIESLKLQLEESKAGLLAAARLSDQLEIAQVTNATIKEERKYSNCFACLIECC